MRFRIVVYILLAITFGCKNAEDNQLFSLLSEGETNIAFTNELTLSEDFDVFRYRNYYNGGGVAIGDINNDGLSDVYLTANMGENKLYLNQGNFSFKDITQSAGVSGSKVWATGVSMADINGDGLLDIYVCNSGDVMGGKRENELFINNGDLTFSEQAAKYGLDDKGFSTHAAFFDYDQDGDLDAYVLNNSFRPVSTLGYENIRHIRDSTGGDKLYRNDKNHFVDVSDSAGIYGSVIGFGLGVTVTDVNQDSWLDIYVSNDFFERDYLYINQQDGIGRTASTPGRRTGHSGFRDELIQRMGHISHFSMGADAADLNNDGYPEIFVTDMLPNTDKRLKTMTNFESYDVHQRKLANGYYEQYMRNTLQLNNQYGNFREIGQLAGVQATDWSWGALIADFDNDLNKELFVSNGVYKDVTDQDFIAYIGSDEAILEAMRKESVNFQELVDQMPSNKLSNYLFKADSNLTYQNVATDWGLATPSFSNGAAYGDLDNDGDLDLIVNNVNQELFVYRNNSDQLQSNHYLKLSFVGPQQNTFGIGARVHAYANGQQVMQENIPTKGFQSSVDYTMVLGFDTLSVVDSLLVHWGYNNRVQKKYNVTVNQHDTLYFTDAVPSIPLAQPDSNTVFQRVEHSLNPAFRHQENRFVDFDYERLTYHMLSREGPALAVADVNQDGLDDFYLGGASGQAGRLYLQRNEQEFEAIGTIAFAQDSVSEDVDATFFDADNDGDLDLYVVSGGNSFRANAAQYQDRLYLLESFTPDGKPIYQKSTEALPTLRDMGSCVKHADFDQDGDEDLFVGGRAIPLQYGLPASSTILRNDGTGKFTDATAQVSPRLRQIGMVTDAEWVDFDRDQDLDLVIVGDWMPVMLLKNNGANLERLNNVPGLENTKGWWREIETTDLNEDGEMDFVLGNWGLNTKFNASPEQPLTLYISDFDENQAIDQVYAYYQGDSLYPMALRHDLVMQLNYLKKEFTYHADYAGKTMEQVFGKPALTNALVNQVHRLQSSFVINNGDGSYQVNDLPIEAQLSPVFSIVSGDFVGNANPELVLAGNFSGVRPEEGRYDANPGLMMSFGNGQFHNKPANGLSISGEVRDMAVARSVGTKRLLIIAKNNEEPEIYVYDTAGPSGKDTVTMLSNR
ncbi:VCBS repeat-containing protein [Tunicatimonas pelagia]|uniref:VCBS repeat-containing protein n=1 Tax=Tunicatimonas pelagia TaxID=931531 RepID=UPI00266520F4|nr:VCBS repeat-containing protein [Tunicatimonas pelagia]WKN40783.1 VCBS repeat-containing protein [Tunicatimonas pelagia]